MGPSAPVFLMTPGTLRQYRDLRSPFDIPETWFVGNRGSVQASTLRRMRDTIARYIASGLLPSTPPWVPWTDEDIDRFAGIGEQAATREPPTLERYLEDGGIYPPVTFGFEWLADVQLAIRPDDLQTFLPKAVYRALSWSTLDRPMAAEDVYAAAAYLATWEADRDFSQRRQSTPAATLASRVRARSRDAGGE